MLQETESNDRKAGWWAWPLIIFTVLFVAIAPRFLESYLAAAPDPEGGEKSEVLSADWGQLALFQLQGKMVVAAASVDERQATETIRQLEMHSKSVHTEAAVALLHSFVEGEDSKEVDRVLKQAKREYGGSPQALEFLQKVGEGIDQGVSTEERQSLEESLGWFAKFFPEKGANGEVLDSPEAEPLIQSSRMMAVGMVGVVFFIGALFIGGCIALSIIVSKVRKPEGRQFDRQRAPAGVMLECFAIYLAVMVFGEVVTSFLPGVLAFAHYPGAIVLALLWPRIRGYTWRETRGAIGWTKGKGTWRELLAGVVGYLSIIPLAAVGITLTMILAFAAGQVSQLSDDSGATKPIESVEVGEREEDAEAEEPVRLVEPEMHPIVGWIVQGGWKEKLLCFLLAAVFAPFAEETLFRGALHRHLRKRTRFVVAALLGGVIFAALHPQGLIAIPALSAMGVGFCLLREWRDSLIAPMVAHAINNGLIVLMVMLIL